jgi:hypothetical protein
MQHGEVMKALRSQSTWRLFGLGIITLGVYWAHYIKRQSAILNAHLEPGRAISEGLTTVLMALVYVSLPVTIGALFVGEDHVLNRVDSTMTRCWAILAIVWGYTARDRVNTHFALESGTKAWMSGLWTFFFTPLYFNYKINQLSEEPVAMDQAGLRSAD